MKTLGRIIGDQKFRIVLALAAGIGLLVLWLSAVDVPEILARLSSLDLRWMGLFTLLWVSAAFLRSLRWRAILSRFERVPPMESFGLFMSCLFINFLVPLRLGEAVTSLALKRRRGIPFSRSLPTQVMDRLFDLTPIVPAILMVFLIDSQIPGPLMTILTFVAVVFTLLTGAVLVAMTRPDVAAATIRSSARLLPSPIRSRSEQFAVRCMEGLAGLRLGVSAISLLVGITFLALAIDSFSLLVIFRSLGYSIAPSLVLAGYTLFFLMSALPRPPGQVGSHEVLFLLIFSLLLGVDKNVASAAIVVGHLMLALLLTATGTISLFALGIRSVSVARDHDLQTRSLEPHKEGSHGVV